MRWRWPPRELVRIAPRVVAPQADGLEVVADPLVADLPVAPAVLGVGLGEEALADDVADGHPRVERADGVLEDDLHPAAELLEVVAPLAEDRPRRRAWPTRPSAAGAGGASRPSVVLPQPDSPTRPKTSPRRTSKLTSSTALTSPTWRRMKPAVDREVLDEVVDLDERASSRESAEPCRAAPALGRGAGRRRSRRPLARRPGLQGHASASTRSSARAGSGGAGRRTRRRGATASRRRRAGSRVAEPRVDLAAGLEGVRAARREVAAGRHVERVRARCP